MRSTRLLFLCSALVGCGGGGSGPNGGDDVQPTPDADTIDPPARGFQIVTPDVDIPAGVEVTYCYYFRTPNTEPLAITKWESNMTPGSHHLILFTTGTTDKMPPGTMSTSGCGFGSSTQNMPSWIYSAQTPTASLQLPTDDGEGKPLAIDIPANSAAFVQLHYLNASDQAIKAHATINAVALEAGAAYTKTAAFVTYNERISIPPNMTNVVQSETIAANAPGFPQGAKFWLMSTHAHHRAIKTEVLDGTQQACLANTTDCLPVFSSNDWEHPGAQAWMTTPFYSFANGVTYRCTYNNQGTNTTIVDGESAASNEMCMASGYYFPATKPIVCIDSYGCL